MLDRLISGAGAVTDAADRFARIVTRRTDGDLIGHRPGSTVVAGLLATLAVVLAVVGLETSDDPRPRDLRPADVAETVQMAGRRTFATMSGVVSTLYMETFFDDNANGEQDENEVLDAWHYFLVDPTTRSGVTVRSFRSPAEVLRLDVRGTVREDPRTIADAAYGFEELEMLGVILDTTRLIDARGTPDGPTTPLDLATDLPSDGMSVAVSASRSQAWVPTCSTETAGAFCDDAEADAYALAIYDEASGHAMLVLVDDPPEFATATFEGMLRRDERAVSFARETMGIDLDGNDLRVSDRFLLEDGAAPANALLIYGSAVVVALIAGAIVVGRAGGYVVYRRSDGAAPRPASTLAVGDRIGLRVTGRLRSAEGPIHVREVPADLVRFATSVGVAPGDESPSSPGSTPPAEGPSTLIIERVDRPEGVAVGLGELTRLTTGRAMLLSGPRPAMRATVASGPIILSFTSEAERDRAAAEMLDETGLGAEV